MVIENDSIHEQPPEELPASKPLAISPERIPTNKEIVEFLLDEKNFSVLENLLAEENKRYNELIKIRHPHYFGGDPLDKNKFLGPKLDLDGLIQEFRGVRERVDRLLCIREVSDPCIQGGAWTKGQIYSSLLSISSGMIASASGLEFISSLSTTNKALLIALLISFPLGGLMKVYHAYANPGYYLMEGGRIKIGALHSSRIEVIPTLAHEYTHHVFLSLFVGANHSLPDKNKDQPSEKWFYGIYNEGFARSIQKLIARLYSKQENNPLIEYSTQEYVTLELRAVYKNLCGEFGVMPQADCIASTVDQSFVDRLPFLTRRGGHYAIGNAYCAMQEALKGLRFYRDIFLK